MNRAQSSVELLIVLAISLTILAVLVNFTTEHVSNLQKEQAVNLTRENVNRLAREIDYVYRSGPGHVRDVVLQFPEGIDSTRSRLENTSIILSVYGTDVSASAIPALQGTVPTSSGLQRVRLVSYANYVSITLVSLVSDQDSIYIAMARDSNATKQVTFTNFSSTSEDYIFTLTWSPTLVDASVSPGSHTFSSGESFAVDLNFTAQGSAFGNYVGFLNAQSSLDDGSEPLIIPINVEVFAPSQTLLTALPATLDFSSLVNDSNTQQFQICNLGNTPIKNISFTPSSAEPGSWITAISSIAQLNSSSCQAVDVTVTVPNGTSSGGYSGSLSIVDYTGANNTILTINANVLNMSDYFVWDWSTARANNTILDNFTIQNNSTQPIFIDQMALKGWSLCDDDNALITDVTLDSKVVFSGGSEGDNTTFDISDFQADATTSYTANEILFDGKISDDNEQFQPIITFTDGSVYTGSTFGDGCIIDAINPGAPLSFAATSGSSAESVLLSFTFPGDDNYTGTVSSVSIRRSDSDINTQAAFDAATDIPYTGSILSAGNLGTLLVDDLNVGYTYYFSIQFYDDFLNESNLPDSASARPFTSFKFSLSDFNITPFAESRISPASGQWDINYWRLQDFSVIPSVDKNVYIRVTDDANVNNNWYTALDFDDNNLIRVRVWYPSPSTPGLPGTTPQYTGTPTVAMSGSGIGMLTTAAFNTQYRFNGNLVSFPGPTHLYVEYFQGFTDMNIRFDGGIR